MDPDAPSSASRVKRRVLVVTILGAGIVFLDSSIATVALPAIQRDLGVPTTLLQWVASGYLLTLSVLLLIGGRLADLYGRRRMFLIGLASYATLAALAGLAPSGLTLTAIRAIQGIAGALLVPTTLALINAVFPAEERGRAIGIWAGWSGITTILGPVAGGFVIDSLSWRYAFFIAPAIALAALALSRPVPESSDPAASRSIDFVGVLLSCIAFGGLVFALIQGPIAGWSAPEVVGAAVLGGLTVPLFVLWERRTAHPMLPFEMFANRNLTAANAVTLFVYAGLYGTFFYVALYVQTALGASATIAGSTFVPITLLLFFLSPYAGRLNDRYGPRWLMSFGPLVAAAGLAVASLTGPGQLWSVLMPGIVVFGIGLGFTVAPLTATAIGSAEERFSGVASGFNNAVSRIAGLLAIALMGIIVVQLWQAGISAEAARAPEAVADSLEAVSVQAFVLPDTGGLTGAEAAESTARALEVARRSFRNGMLLAAALVAIGGVLAAALIRNPPRAGLATVPAPRAPGQMGCTTPECEPREC